MTTNTDIISPISSDVVAFLETFSSPLSTLAVGTETQPVPGNVAQSSSNAEMPITIFLTYVSIDNAFKDRIEGVLQTLQLQGCPIKDWICCDIDEAVEFFTDIRDPLSAYQLFLFLLSPDFVRHSFCYSDEVRELIERHLTGVWVSPILIRVCRWQQTPFGCTPRLPVLPNSRQPVTKWSDPDEAYDEIARKIEIAVGYLRRGRI
jgi:hypothetical protein